MAHILYESSFHAVTHFSLVTGNTEFLIFTTQLIGYLTATIEIGDKITD